MIVLEARRHKKRNCYFFSCLIVTLYFLNLIWLTKNVHVPWLFMSYENCNAWKVGNVVYLFDTPFNSIVIYLLCFV